MSSKRCLQINIGDELSVNDDEGVVFEMVASVIEAAAGTQDDRFVDDIAGQNVDACEVGSAIRVSRIGVGIVGAELQPIG